MSIPLKNLFEVAGRLLIVGAPRVRQIIDGVEMAGPLRPGPLKLGGNTRIVLQRLADRVNFSSNTAEARAGAWLARTALAGGTMSVKTVDRALAELKALGLIKVEARFSGSGKSADSQLSNLYTFNVVALDACKGADKFKSVVVIPAAGLSWPKVREHGLKKAERKNGFPFEHRCKPRQSSVSKTPSVISTPEPIKDTGPKEIGLGVLALPHQEERKGQGPGGGACLNALSVQARDRQGPQPCLSVL